MIEKPSILAALVAPALVWLWLYFSLKFSWEVRIDAANIGFVVSFLVEVIFYYTAMAFQAWGVA